MATNRLGAGLIAAGRAAEAVAVYEAGLEANAGNTIMLNRLIQARHAAGLKPASRSSDGGTRSSGRRRSGPTGWIKALRPEGDGWPDAPEARDWVNDPGKIERRRQPRPHRARRAVGRAELAGRRSGRPVLRRDLPGRRARRGRSTQQRSRLKLDAERRDRMPELLGP